MKKFILLIGSFCLPATGLFSEDMVHLPGIQMNNPVPVQPNQAAIFSSSVLPDMEGLMSPLEFEAFDAPLGDGFLEGEEPGEREVSPYITQLARALDNDPYRIFEYLCNHIEYAPSYGLRNSATATLLAGRGNTLEVAALLRALLKAADPSIPTYYGNGNAYYAKSFMSDLLQVDEDQVVSYLAGSCGIPAAEYSSSQVIFHHFWVVAGIDGQWRHLNAAFHEVQNGSVLDMTSAMGYARTNFLSEVLSGATEEDDSIKDIHAENLRAKMQTYSTALYNYLEEHDPLAETTDVLGGQRILPVEVTSLPRTPSYAHGDDGWGYTEELPSSLLWRVNIQYRDIDYTNNTYALAGKRMTMFHTGASGAPELQIGGELVATGVSTPGGEFNSMSMIFERPNQSTMTNNFTLKGGNEYALLMDFETQSPELLAMHSDELAASQAEGLSADSEEVLGETLYTMGLSYMRQWREDARLAGQLSGVAHSLQLTAGVMAQEEGYYIDVPMSSYALKHHSGDATLKMQWLKRMGLLGSAFEHGILEQMQGTNNAGISTVRILELNNAAGHETYYGTNGNWYGAGNIRSKLVGFSGGELARLDSYIDSGYNVVVPRRGDTTLQEWSGSGYVITSDNVVGMQIEGGYNGGYSASQGTVNSVPVQAQTTISYNPPPRANVAPTPSKEPVDLATGHYLVETTDMTTGGSSPLGFSFQRFYNSGQKGRDSGLGHGWRHSLDIHASQHTHSDPGLGHRQAKDAVPYLVLHTIAMDLLENETPLRAFTISALSAKWVMDQLIDNAVTLQFGNRSLEYIRLPDGTYSAPEGVTAELTESNGVFHLQERLGTEFQFNADGILEDWKDADGNTLAFNYNAQTNLQTVTDAYGRTLTFGYTDGRISTLTDSTGRQTSYGYSDGDLVTYTDPESHIWSYQYNTNHQITALIDPENITTIQNLYDPLGCVTQQLSATSNVWNFYVGGQLGIEEDADGNRTTHTFDSNGRNQGTRNALGEQTHIAYNGQGQPVTNINARGIVTRRVYDNDRNLIEKHEALGTPEQRASYYNYDPNHNLICTSNQINGTDWQVSLFEYDTEHHVTKSTDPLGNETTFEYWPNGRLKKKTEDGGRTTDYTYDAQGNPDTVISTDAGTIDLDYNARGERIQTTDARGQTTGYTFDANGKPLSVLYADGASVSNGYWDNGLLKETTDAKGETVSKVWNNAYKLQTVTYSDGGIVSNSYDSADRLIATKDTKNETTHYELDAIGQTLSVSSVYSVVENSYDPAGNLTNSTVDPTGLNLWTATEYDTLNRPTSVQTALSTLQSQYDSLGRVTNRIDQLSTHWKSEYDALSRPVKSIRPSENFEEYGYDALGNRTQFWNADRKQITFGFDAQGRMTSITNALGKVTSYSHNLNGNISFRRDAEGAETLYDYDEMNRLTNVVHESVWKASFEYDLNGNNVAQASPLASLSLGYDSMNRLASSLISVNSRSFAVTNFYDLNGNRTNIVYPGGLTVAYEYDEENRLESVTTEYAENTESFSFGYDNAGRVTGMSYPNGVNSTFGYDAESRITGYSYNNGSNFVQRSITRDPRGFKTSDDIIQGLEPAFMEGEQRREHNAADQLTHIDQRDTWLGGAVDQWYNRDYTYNDNGCLTQEDINRPEWNTNATIHECTTDYIYDYDNRLKSVTGGLPYSTTEYLYDAYGVRVGRVTSPGVTNYFVIDYTDPLKRPLAETDSNGAVTRYYVWAGFQLLAHIEADETTRYYHQDELGSTLALTDETGAVTDEFAYIPSGVATHTGSADTPYQWLGGYGVYYDSKTDLHLTLHRAYSAHQKRFISSDPLGIDGGVNLYAYGNLNPLFFVDPYGLCAESFWSQGIESALDNGMDWLQGKAQQASDSFSSFSDEYIYGPVAQRGDRVNDWLGSNVGVPGSELLTAVNDYLDDRSTAEKLGIALAPTGGGLLFTEGGMFVAGQILVNGTVQYLIQDASSGTPGLIDTTAEAYKSLEVNGPVILDYLSQ